MSRMIFCVFGILTLFVPFHRYLGGYLNFDQHFNSLEQFENFDQHFGRTLKGFVDGMTEAADVAATDMADRIGYAFFLNFLGKNDLNFTYAYPYIRLNTLVRMAFNFLLFFFVNGTIFLYFMYRGLVKMEPITEPHSSESKQFHKSFRAARKDFNRHNFASARGRLDHCLQA